MFSCEEFLRIDQFKSHIRSEIMKTSVFQINVLHLLGQRATLCGNIFIEKKSVSYFGDSRNLDSRRMGQDEIEVELLIVQLILDSQSNISLQDLLELYVKIVIHKSIEIQFHWNCI